MIIKNKEMSQIINVMPWFRKRRFLMMNRGTWGVLLFAFSLVWFFLFAFVPSLYAHDAKPVGHMRLILGQSFPWHIFEPPQGDCRAYIEVDVADSSIAQILNPAPVMSLGHTYTIQASATKTGTTNLRAHYIGEDLYKSRELGEEPTGNCWGEGLYFIKLEVIDPQGESSANMPFSGEAADPINTRVGEHYFRESFDLFLGGPMPLYFQRYYGSKLQYNTVLSDLGDNWRHNNEWNLHAVNDAVTIIDHMGRTIKFLKQGGIWNQQSNAEVLYQLVDVQIVEDGETVNGYKLYNPTDGYFYTFNHLGRLISVEDGKGNGHYLIYNDYYMWPYSGKLFRINDHPDGSGRSLFFDYSSCTDPCIRKLVKVTEMQGNVKKRYVSFAYTEDNLTGFTDARGNSTTYNYTTAGGLGGLLTSRTRPEGNSPFSQTYDGQGQVAGQADSGGNTTTIAYNTPLEGATTITGPNAQAMRHMHGDRNSLTQWTDQDGETVALSYDGSNRRTSVTDRLGDTTSTVYHAESGKPASYTDTLGNTTSFAYTPRTQGGFTLYDLTRVNYPDGTSVGMTFDASGNMLTRTDRSGKVWTYAYNGRGQALTVTNPQGGVTTATYNDDGTLATVKDHFNSVNSFQYDVYRRLIKVTYMDSTFRTMTYDNNDNLLTAKDERGKTATYTYDKNNNVKSITDPLGSTITYVYDGNDRFVSIIDRMNKSTSYGYDALGRLATVTNPANETLTLGYNAHGWLTSVTDPGGKTVVRNYDKEGVLSSWTDPINRTWSRTTDKLGRITRLLSPLSHRRDYSYDTMGRLISMKDPLSRITTYSYDARGFLTAVQMPEGISASYTRSDFGLITRITDPRGNLWDHTYDQTGRHTAWTDPLGRLTAYAYDSRNRLSTVTFPEGSLQMTYDGTGNLTRRLYSDGTDLQYSFDDNNRLLTATGLSLSYEPRGGIIGCNGLTIDRDDVGRIASITLAPEKVVKYTYNNRGFVSRVSDWIGGSTDLVYDDRGRPTGISRPNGISSSCTYDQDGRIVGTTEQKAETLSSIVLTRNGVGEITSATRDVPLVPYLKKGSRSFTYNAAGHITGCTYDARGRMTGDDKRSYTWDMASRLISYTEKDGGTTDFTYDGLGMRTSRTSGGGSETYVWNYALGLPAVSVAKAGGIDRRYYIHLPDGRLLHSIEATDNMRRFYHFDEMGTTLFLSDDSGVITDSYGTTPYGAVTARQGATPNPLTFLGGLGVMEEGDTGLFYMRARWYDSAPGRFISPDSVKSLRPQAINPYQYALANPLRYADPSGMQEQPEKSDDGLPDVLDSANKRGSIRETPRKLDPMTASEYPSPNAGPKQKAVTDPETTEDWYKEIARKRSEVSKKLAEYPGGTYNPLALVYVSAEWDSKYLGEQNESDPLYNFRGKVMMGAELNYYFFGMLISESGWSEGVMTAGEYIWNACKWQRPNERQLFAAMEGYRDNERRKQQETQAAMQVQGALDISAHVSQQRDMIRPDDSGIADLYAR